MAESPDDAVRQQYEELPYPARDPTDEAKRLIVGSPSHLLEIEHYVFAGHRAGPLRALVAGGGTGDGAIMLAQQLAWRGEGEVVYLDISGSALAIAKARAEARGLANISFHRGSLLAIDTLRLGRFDYIDCCGVLHHLAEPAEGLLALSEALRDDGGMGLMLYGALGRTGVYPLQRCLRRLTAGAELPERLALTRRLLQGLPQTNWFRRNPFLSDHLRGDDAALFDLLLHARDRAYGVTEIVRLLERAGLRLTGFVPAVAYDPAVYLGDADLRSRAKALPPQEAAALAEDLAGNLKSHIFYVVREANEAGGAVEAPAPELVPILREYEPAALARSLARSGAFKFDLDGFEARFELPAAAPDVIRLIDGTRTLAEIVADLRRRNSRLSESTIRALFEQVYRVLNPLNILLFGGPNAPRR